MDVAAWVVVRVGGLEVWGGGWRGGFSERGGEGDELVGRRMLPSWARGRQGKRVLRRVDILVVFGEVELVTDLRG